MTNETGNAVNISAETVPMFFGSRRPKIWLRRCPENAKRAVRDYDLNRSTQAEAASLENLRRVLGRG